MGDPLRRQRAGHPSAGDADGAQALTAAADSPAARLVVSAARLRERLAALSFAPPVTHVYDPLTYAWEPHRRYLERYGDRTGRTLLVGMNPGPFGMAQTGVPFGDVGMVRDWLGIEAPVARPPREHPKRPVEGFACRRGEVSGRRLWGWAKSRHGTPEQFFSRYFVLNYCPLAFLEENGRNRTPDKLPAAEREPLHAACDDALREAIAALAPCRLIGIGRFAEDCLRRVTAGSGPPISRILHPSPASPAANRGWEEAVDRQLGDWRSEIGD